MTVENLPRRQFLRGKFLTALRSEDEQKQGFAGVRPPWAVANADFVEQCTRCGDCILLCETHILVKGDGGFPEVRFSHGECTFCKKCALVCEQPIFRAFEEQPWAHKIAIQPQCLTEYRIECRACQDSCPTRAIKFRWQAGGIAKPTVEPEACTGCGACLSRCPAEAIKLDYPTQYLKQSSIEDEQ